MNMKVFCLLLCLGYIYCFEESDVTKYGRLVIPQLSSSVKCNHSRDLNIDVSDIDVYFYDFSQRYMAVSKINSAADRILEVPRFDANRKFIIYVPGYKATINKTIVEEVRNTFKTYPNSYLIILDHSKFTNDDYGIIKGYERAVTNVYYIGKALAKMLAKLTKGKVSIKNIHCIGHSIGSQILGHTGEIFNNITGYKIVRITALDPAGPCFSNSFIQNQVRSGVAEYVEVYHCNAGGLGTTSVLGNIDFFADNEGAFLPKCKRRWLPYSLQYSRAAICSHRACLSLYLATVNHSKMFVARKCKDYSELTTSWVMHPCSRNNVIKAGFWKPATTKGIYSFSTYD